MTAEPGGATAATARGSPTRAFPSATGARPRADPPRLTGPASGCLGATDRRGSAPRVARAPRRPSRVWACPSCRSSPARGRRVCSLSAAGLARPSSGSAASAGPPPSAGRGPRPCRRVRTRTGRPFSLSTPPVPSRRGRRSRARIRPVHGGEARREGSGVGPCKRPAQGLGLPLLGAPTLSGRAVGAPSVLRLGWRRGWPEASRGPTRATPGPFLPGPRRRPASRTSRPGAARPSPAHPSPRADVGPDLVSGRPSLPPSRAATATQPLAARLLTFGPGDSEASGEARRGRAGAARRGREGRGRGRRGVPVATPRPASRCTGTVRDERPEPLFLRAVPRRSRLGPGHVDLPARLPKHPGPLSPRL